MLIVIHSVHQPTNPSSIHPFTYRPIYLSAALGEHSYVNKRFRGEGYSSAFFGNDDEVPYGCWFMTARGSGVKVNTGAHWMIDDDVNVHFDDDDRDDDSDDALVCVELML